MSECYAVDAPSRAIVDTSPGAVVLQFGTGWCGWCRAAEPLIDRAFADFADIAHRRIEDGPGRALGRSFRVKLWPTLVFLADGREVARVVRPPAVAPVIDALTILSAATRGDR